MTREEFVIRWRTRQSEWARIGALVDGVCRGSQQRPGCHHTILSRMLDASSATAGKSGNEVRVNERPRLGLFLRF